MDMILWAKTLMEAYPKLDGRIRKSEERIDAFVKSCFASKRSADKELYALFDMTQAKNRLIYLKNLIMEINEKIGKENVKTVRMRYCDNISFKDIAEIMDINIRNVFRKIDKEIDAVKEALLDMGFDEETCQELWGSDTLITALLKKNAENKISYKKSDRTIVYFDRIAGDDKKEYPKDERVIHERNACWVAR